MLHIPIVHAYDVSKQIPRKKKIFLRFENVIRYEALGKFGEHSRSLSCSWLCLEQLLRIFCALQTSCMLHISMNARLRMNQLLIILFAE